MTHALGGDRPAFAYTFVFDGRQIRVMPVGRAVEWWQSYLRRRARPLH